MKILITMLLLLALGGRAEVVTASTVGHVVAFTNDQSHSVWTPSALLFSREPTEPVELAVYRYGNEQQVLLGRVSATATNLTWLPRARYVFGTGSSLVVVSSVSNFTVQLHRGPFHD